MADFTNPFTVFGLFATLAIVVPQWIHLRTLDLERIDDSEYDQLVDRVRRRSFGSIVLTNTTALSVINTVLYLAFWLILFFRIADGPNADVAPSNAFYTYYTVEWAVALGAIWLHKIAVASFQDLKWYSLAAAMEFLAWIAWLVVAIFATIEIANLPSPLPATETNNEEIAFVIIAWLLVVWTTVLVVWRGFIWSASNEAGYGRLEDTRLLSTAKPGAAAASTTFSKSAAQQRAAHVLNRGQ